MTTQKIDSLNELSQRVCDMAPLLKGAVDDSIQLKKQGYSQQVDSLWEDFLGEFIRYIKLKSKEEDENLLANLSISRILNGR